jgi:hypothetical protein
MTCRNSGMRSIWLATHTPARIAAIFARDVPVVAQEPDGGDVVGDEGGQIALVAPVAVGGPAG